MKRGKKQLLFGLIGGGILLLVIPLVLSVIIYESYFGSRYETPSEWKYEVSEFNQLEQTPAYFKSNDEQLLAGYIYTNSEQIHPNGVIIMAHGYGAGHNSYLPEIQYITENGYTVFAYDGTGNDESEGKSINGLPQAVIDLDYAINYIKNDEQFDGLPIMLYGHSLGGYAVIAVLNQHSDITAVVERSGFCDSIDILDEIGTEKMGKFFHLLKPYFKLYELLKFGKYATLSGLDVLSSTGTNVLFMHSEDDEVVDYEQNFGRYERLYGARINFTFISYGSRGHDLVVNESLVQTIRSQIKTDDKDISQEKQNLYHDVLYDSKERLDLNVMRQIIEFYNRWVIKEYE